MTGEDSNGENAFAGLEMTAIPKTIAQTRNLISASTTVSPTSKEGRSRWELLQARLVRWRLLEEPRKRSSLGVIAPRTALHRLRDRAVFALELFAPNVNANRDLLMF